MVRNHQYQSVIYSHAEVELTDNDEQQPKVQLHSSHVEPGTTSTLNSASYLQGSAHGEHSPSRNYHHDQILEHDGYQASPNQRQDSTRARRTHQGHSLRRQLHWANPSEIYRPPCREWVCAKPPRCTTARGRRCVISAQPWMHDPFRESQSWEKRPQETINSAEATLDQRGQQSEGNKGDDQSETCFLR
ncbi:hypothetical protein B0H13DRAFT_2034173 [Mycena leptocephala]|nr:hypothetical protein B0H13DRAFT_2034173 [Mycena leptocephala]